MNYDWKIHKKLLDAGGLGSVVYILPARCNNKLALEQEIVNKLLSEGRTVVYGRPKQRQLRGTSFAGICVDIDILTPEAYERAERIWNEYWKNKHKGE
jgi:NDP-sugar pyrophosphorylase family protein